MIEEIKTSPDIAPDSNELDVPPVKEETAAEQAAVSAAAATAPARKGDPWKTAFIVLAGITIISGTIYFTTYGKRSDLPTVPAADPAALPVQMVNHATGQSEAAALSQQVPTVVGNAAGMMPGGIPGGDGYDPWANPGRYSQPGNTSTSTGPYQVYPSGPPGQNVYMETNPNSPFMSDGKTYMMVPANTAVNANRGGNTNTNRGKPVTSPTPVTTAPAGNTAVPAQTKPPTGKPDAQPAANKPAQKPVKKTTGKPSGTDE
jgi:hypothetical protein